MKSPTRCIQASRRGRKRYSLPNLPKVRAGPDYEVLPETGEAMIRLAMIHLMVRRITKKLAS